MLWYYLTKMKNLEAINNSDNFITWIIGFLRNKPNHLPAFTPDVVELADRAVAWSTTMKLGFTGLPSAWFSYLLDFVYPSFYKENEDLCHVTVWDVINLTAEKEFEGNYEKLRNGVYIYFDTEIHLMHPYWERLRKNWVEGKDKIYSKEYLEAHPAYDKLKELSIVLNSYATVVEDIDNILVNYHDTLGDIMETETDTETIKNELFVNIEQAVTSFAMEMSTSPL